MLETLRYHWMLWNWRRRAKQRKRSHFALHDLPAFFRRLNDQGVRYVVLRWFDEVPMTPEAEAATIASHGDLDMLADARDLLAICRAAAAHPGKVKVDLYSDRLLLGTDLRRFTYYPPLLCQELLDHAVLDPRGFRRPDDLRHLYSLSYHLTYQKGTACALPSGFPDLPSAPKESFRHDAEQTLRSLAEAAGVTLPAELTLLNLHRWLKERNWNMPFDLLLRWPHRQKLLDRLYQFEAEQLRTALGPHRDLCVFLLREDAIRANATQDILDEIAAEYRILDTLELTPEQQNRVTRRTRGGNWTKHKALRLYLPEVAVVCQAKTPRQIDDTAVAAQDQDSLNPNLRFKHALRERLSRRYPDANNLLHGSDNDVESMEYIQAIYGDEWPARFSTLFS